jgi:hypothetical protein
MRPVIYTQPNTSMVMSSPPSHGGPLDEELLESGLAFPLVGQNHHGRRRPAGRRPRQEVVGAELATEELQEPPRVASREPLKEAVPLIPTHLHHLLRRPIRSVGEARVAGTNPTRHGTCQLLGERMLDSQQLFGKH